MLLCRARHIIPAFRRLRPYSTAQNPYSQFEKLRAYPFAFDENEAKRLIAPVASVLCKSQTVTSSIHRFLPILDLPYFQPQRIIPIYFPAWIIDAEVQAQVRYHGVERRASAQLQNAYLPGSDYQVLSTVPLFPLELQEVTPLPWSEGLLQQQGQQVTCLPFNVDPIEGLKSFSDEGFDGLQGLHASLSTIESTLSVYRPVLLPLYLAQYESVGPEPNERRACTAFIDASSKAGTVYAIRAHTSQDDWDSSVIQASKSFDMLLSPYSDVLYLGQKNDWVDVENVSLPPHRDISSALGKWIDRKMYLPETIQKAAAASSNPSDQDSRIREYDVEDRDEVQQWMGVGAELMLVRRILERINEQVEAMGDEGASNMMSPIETLKLKEKELVEQRDELLPEWSKPRTPSDE